MTDIKKRISKMIESILAKIGLPLLITFISESLRGINSPVTRTAADALERVDDALKAGAITPEQMAEANRHLENLAQLKSEEFKVTLSEINQTMRAEVASQDKYVRRMRPTFGYLMALTWAAQMFGIAYVIIFDTDRAGAVMAAMGSLSAIWGIGLSVLGIYVYRRSDDKKLPTPEVIFWNK